MIPGNLVLGLCLQDMGISLQSLGEEKLFCLSGYKQHCRDLFLYMDLMFPCTMKSCLFSPSCYKQSRRSPAVSWPLCVPRSSRTLCACFRAQKKPEMGLGQPLCLCMWSCFFNQVVSAERARTISYIFLVVPGRWSVLSRYLCYSTFPGITIGMMKTMEAVKTSFEPAPTTYQACCEHKNKNWKYWKYTFLLVAQVFILHPWDLDR